MNWLHATTKAKRNSIMPVCGYCIKYIENKVVYKFSKKYSENTVCNYCGQSPVITRICLKEKNNLYSPEEFKKFAAKYLKDYDGGC